MRTKLTKKDNAPCRSPPGAVLIIPAKGLDKFEKRNAACEGILRKLKATNMESALRKARCLSAACDL